MTRYRLGGYAALAARSKELRTIPARTSGELEDRIVAVRKELGDQGLDCGAHTIHYHLGLRSRARLRSPPSGACSLVGASSLGNLRYSELESELFFLGISFKHSRPYHSPTLGKVERFLQTLKRHLDMQSRAALSQSSRARTSAS